MGGNAVFKGEDCVEELCESASSLLDAMVGVLGSWRRSA